MSEERFSIIRCIRKGPNTGDYEALDTKTNQKVNIRRCLVSDAAEQDTSWHESFLSLGKSLSSIDHPHILGVNEAGFDEDGPYISCELVEMEPTLEVFPHGLSNETFEDASLQILTALEKIHHQQLTHGAVVPDTLQVITAKGNPQFLINDLGMHWVKSMLRGESYSYQDPIFMPPEFTHDTQATKRSDVYMFGHLLYCLWAGAHPLSGMDIAEAVLCHKNHDFPSISDIKKGVPLAWSQWLDKLTAAEPSDRPADASAALACMPAPTLAAEKGSLDPNNPLIKAATANGIAAPRLASPKLAIPTAAHSPTATSPASATTAGKTGFSAFTPAAPLALQKSPNSKLAIFSIAALVITAVVLGIVISSKKAEYPENTIAKKETDLPATRPTSANPEQATEKPKAAASVTSTDPVTKIATDKQATNSNFNITFSVSGKEAVVYRSQIKIPHYTNNSGESIIYPNETKGKIYILGVSKIGQFNETPLAYSFFKKQSLETRSCGSARRGFRENQGWKIELANPAPNSKNYTANLYFLQSDADLNLTVKIGNKSYPYTLPSRSSKIVGRILQLRLNNVPAKEKITLELTFSRFKQRAIGGFSGIDIVPTEN